MQKQSDNFSSKLDRLNKQIEETETQLTRMKVRRDSIKKQDCFKAELISIFENSFIEQVETEFGAGCRKLTIVLRNE